MILNDSCCQLPSWLGGSGTTGAVIMASRVRLARNLHGFRFAAKASLQERKTIFETVADACRRLPRCRRWTVSNFLTIGPLARQMLVEERVASGELERGEGDRGVIYSLRRGASIMVNEEDHIRLCVMGAGDGVRHLWEYADAVDAALGKKLPFAFDRTRGFLTSCPTNAGTGLRVSFLMHLPGLALTRTVDQVMQGASQTGFSVRGFFGEHSEIVGNLFQVSNQGTLGVSEIDCVDSTRTMVERMVALEATARERVLREARTELSDKIGRSYGILTHAGTLTVAEYLNLASALRLGIDVGLFKEVTLETLSRLTIAVMPAHMQTLLGEQADERELGVMRAQLVRQGLGG